MSQENRKSPDQTQLERSLSLVNPFPPDKLSLDLTMPFSSAFFPPLHGQKILF
jgi:hypothetical protein